MNRKKCYSYLDDLIYKVISKSLNNKVSKKFIVSWFCKELLAKRIDNERTNEERLVILQYDSDKHTTPLSKKEKLEINNLWGQILPVTSYKEYEMFKNVYGFDARFLTHHIYLPILARLLNDYNYTKMFDDKGLLGYMGNSDIKFPYCFARYIEGDFYTNDMQQMTRDEVVRICSAQEELFIKPSKETSGGNGAELIRLDGRSLAERITRIEKTLVGRSRDFVIQECLHQHPVMAQFNKSSINTFRVTSLLLNGSFTVCSIILRFGREGMTVDNWGAGGLLVSVNNDGKLSNKAYDIQLNEYTSCNNVFFSETQIPQIPYIINQIEEAHTKHFALCKFIGWDVALNTDGEAVVLEMNSSQPGVIGEQLISGPIFGNRTQEVIDYCKTKRFQY